MQFCSYGFEIILNPRSQCPYTGKEQLIPCVDPAIKCFEDAQNGSYRFVLYIGGRSVSALQIMSCGPGIGQTANVFTKKEHRRKGYAARVWKEAKRHFQYISHSPNRSEDGEKYVLRCSGPLS